MLSHPWAAPVADHRLAVPTGRRGLRRRSSTSYQRHRRNPQRRAWGCSEKDPRLPKRS